MPRCAQIRHKLFAGTTLGLIGVLGQSANAQQGSIGQNPINAIQVSTQSILLDSTASIIDETDEQIQADAQSTPARLPLDVSQEQIGDTELVQQLYPNGSLKVAKHVKLDSNGNYVNHGEYQEWTESGEVRIAGQYEMGKRQGLWVRFCSAKESKLLETEPYNKFKAPFQSTAEFTDGTMNGVWTITDKDGKKISEIQLLHGKRHGIATWYHTNGTALWQSEYKNGLLDGVFTEKDAAGKLVRQTQFINGQKSEKKSEQYANKKPKLEFQLLTPAQLPTSLDDWTTTTLATYDVKGEETKHGTYTVYYENGSIRSQANYRNGVQDGDFVGYFPNNQREVQGSYRNGKQQGKWSWWHENGMRKAIANYEQGSLTEPSLAWNDQGERTESADMPKSQPVSTQAPDQSTSSRASSNIRRPSNK